jgi:RHS repeat-associated protein
VRDRRPAGGSNGRASARSTGPSVDGLSENALSPVGTRILSDHLGSPRAVVDAAGAVVESIAHDEWGNVIGYDVVTSDGYRPIPFGFAGGLYDEATEQVRFGARDYDPEVGRWASKDPLGFDYRHGNFGMYTINDFMNFVDISGKGPINIMELTIVVASTWEWFVIDDPPWKCWDPWPSVSWKYDTYFFPDDPAILGYPEYDTIGPPIPRQPMTCDYQTAIREIVKSDPRFVTKWIRWTNITAGNFDARNQLNMAVQDWISRCRSGQQ